MATISTHVLDTSLGRPAAGVAVRLEWRRAMGWLEVARGVTDEDGRVRALGEVEAGVFRITFDTEPYFAALRRAAFFPSVDVVFRVTGAPHYHVPLLISPFGYSTYRGS